jgi:hypothetical protein
MRDLGKVFASHVWGKNSSWASFVGQDTRANLYAESSCVLIKRMQQNFNFYMGRLLFVAGGRLVCQQWVQNLDLAAKAFSRINRPIIYTLRSALWRRGFAFCD